MTGGVVVTGAVAGDSSRNDGVPSASLTSPAVAIAAKSTATVVPASTVIAAALRSTVAG